jgi:hypothetical protein
MQYSQLRWLLSKSYDTQIGNQYKFSSIRDYAAFSKQVPVHSYETLFPYIQKMIEGKKNILWPGQTVWFAKSSGTTNDRSKYIPVTRESLRQCHYAGGRDCISLYLQNNRKSHFFSGKGVVLGGSLRKSEISDKALVGDLSAVMIKNIPEWANFLRTPAKKIMLMDDWTAKMEAISNSVVHENVTSLSGVPSWFLALIKYILNKNRKTTLTEIWPNLEVFFHGGIGFEPYIGQYKALIPSPNMHYMETYNASEGFFGIQNDLSDKTLLLMLDYGIFYEFLPMENLESPEPQLLPLEGVETGKHYAMVITTNSGLWRYMIGDTICFTEKNPWKFLITGRTKQFINAFGEELMVHNAEVALTKACQETNSIIKDYTVAPVYMTSKDVGHHQWIIEFEKQPDSLFHFTEILDTTLKTINSDYDAKRYNNMTLKEPEIIIARKDLFYQWLENKNKLGGQFKVPRLCNDRKYIEELLQM